MNLSDHDLLVAVIVVALLWMLGLGIWWERNRAGGTRDQRRHRDTARAERDEARRQVAELCDTFTTATGHPIGLPRPGAGTAGAAQAPVSPTAEPARSLRVVHGGDR